MADSHSHLQCFRQGNPSEDYPLLVLYTPCTARWKGGSDDRCWCHCGASDTLTHLLWHCPKLHRYWEDVFADIDQMFHTEVHHFPSYILLSLLNTLKYPMRSKQGRLPWHSVRLNKSCYHYGAQILYPPTLICLHKLCDLLSMEKLTSNVEHTIPTFEKTWGPCFHFLSTTFWELSCPLYLRFLRLTINNSDTT